MFHYRVFMVACLLTCLVKSAYADHPSLGFGTEGAGPIITIQAATMPQGAFALGMTSEYIESEPFSDSELINLAGGHVHAHSADWLLSTVIGISYGLADNLTLSLRLPYIYRDNIRAGDHSHGGGGVVNSVYNLGDSSGPGDIAVLGKFRVWNQERHQGALLLGAKLPTGRTDVKHGNEKLEAEHQPGSGSWDSMLGIAVGTKAGLVSFDANALYTIVTEGKQDTDLGDRLQYNLSASYRIGGATHEHDDFTHQHKAWDLVLELNGEWVNQQKIAGETDQNSGGNQIFLSPGMRYSPDEKWSAHFSVGTPIVSNPGKGHSDTAYKATLGIARSF
ncbi:MAG: hypothetical protein CO093_01290 [Alphaproteobacteria bacterium CG_4_9_14_3_um_filter_47_13]|nr:MAG: hypothetical protein CO093_01290 [Alphaproteobacteria bacterium CG_4_9_14_3_um_filter_47_13]